MILCLCEGLSEGKLREEIRGGASDVRELVRKTGAGSHCGSCACDLKRLVCEAREQQSADEALELLAAK